MKNVSKNFVAIDFETADQGRDSACAVGLVTVFNSKIVKRESHLIRPPRRTFIFSYIHGIEWSHVAKKPTFAALWVLNEASNEIREQYLSAAKARTALRWKPLYALDEGLRRTIAWYRDFLAEAGASR